MDEQKQQSQKTVVAFVAGLLIGGLLVWVFGSSKNDDPEVGTATTTDSQNITLDEGEVSLEGDTIEGPQAPTTTETSPVTSMPTVTGDGSIKVSSQTAGSVVTLGDLAYPDTDGWIVVREGTVSSYGNILGAARYSTSEGLNPKSVELLRGTQKDMSYVVFFYNDNGDKSFDSTKDSIVMGKNGSPIAGEFTAN